MSHLSTDYITTAINLNQKPCSCTTVTQAAQKHTAALWKQLKVSAERSNKEFVVGYNQLVIIMKLFNTVLEQLQVVVDGILLENTFVNCRSRICTVLFVGAGAPAEDKTVTRLRRELASPPSRSTPPDPHPAESAPFASPESSGNPASRRKISTDSARLFLLRNCRTANTVCRSTAGPAAALLLSAEASGDAEGARASFALLFPQPSFAGSVFMSFSSSASTGPPCTAAIF